MANNAQQTLAPKEGDYTRPMLGSDIQAAKADGGPRPPDQKVVIESPNEVKFIDVRETKIQEYVPTSSPARAKKALLTEKPRLAEGAVIHLDLYRDKLPLGKHRKQILGELKGWKWEQKRDLRFGSRSRRFENAKRDKPSIRTLNAIRSLNPKLADQLVSESAVQHTPRNYKAVRQQHVATLHGEQAKKVVIQDEKMQPSFNKRRRRRDDLKLQHAQTSAQPSEYSPELIVLGAEVAVHALPVLALA